jgi:glycosyltransferase involved in cell wall biosynthesis
LSSEALVEVLLATYNGERYLEEQIDSILAQDYPNLRVLARDDGSEDGTPAILNRYEARFPDRFRVLRTGHATPSAKDNFLRLMRASDGEYVCFCDQDDVWLPHKVSLTKQSMDQLESTWGKDLPLLVFTDLRVVDDKLETLHESFWKHEKLDPARIHRFGSLLSQNVVTGCTAMLNRRLVELAGHMPTEAYMHDQWVALLASAMGKATHVDALTVLYRQHRQNLVGSKKQIGSFPELIRRVRNGDVRRSQWRTSLRQAQSFFNLHHAQLPVRHQEQLLAFLRCGTTRSRLLRTYLLIRHGFLRNGLLEKLATLADQWTTDLTA